MCQDICRQKTLLGDFKQQWFLMPSITNACKSCRERRPAGAIHLHMLDLVDRCHGASTAQRAGSDAGDFFACSKRAKRPSAAISVLICRQMDCLHIPKMWT